MASTANPHYALAQLLRALAASSSHSDPGVRERAGARVEHWHRVLEGMLRGELAIGSRTPTGAPAWATPEVVHGGFATGKLAAGGPPLAHERALASRLGVAPGARRALALHYLSDAGRDELRRLLAGGCFRIDVPEEGALLAVAALLARGAPERAADVVDAILPYVDRLRFFPQPSSRPITAASTVHVATIGETRAALRAIDTPGAVLRMNESLRVWRPITDRAVDLLRETVSEGVPCRTIPPGWRLRAAALVAEHAAACAQHPLCRRPHRPKGNLAIAMRALGTLRDPDAVLSPRELGLVRVALAGHQGKHGAPDTGRRAAHRAEQTRVASLPTRGKSARAIEARLDALPADAALASLDEAAGPLADGPHAGTPLWPSVVAKLQRCVDASVEELVERGVLTSGEAIARVLPQLSAHVRALGFADPEIARLHAAVDAAFRRRRSLLLLDYQSQVRLAELPWMAALEPFRVADGASRAGARRLFSRVTALAIESFPHAIVPNPLLAELGALARPAGIDLPIVDELAADIFMGGFTAKFVRAAETVARRLEGTVYARYYALPIAEVRAIVASLAADTAASPPGGGAAMPAEAGGRRPAAGPVPAFGALCERMARLEPGLGRSVARNGRVIEQQQILTTQNLVPLVDAAGLDAGRFPELAERSWNWLARRVQRKVRSRSDRLRTAKNAAYAWRQAIAYLSLSPAGAVDAFLAESRTRLSREPEPFRARLAAILVGLEQAHSDREPEVRLLGWSSGPHPLVDG